MRGRLWRIIHGLIILNFLVEIIYGTYMVFFVIGGRSWPLFAQAADTPLEVILKRRLYAVETWLAMVGLGIYVAVTEILPRKVRRWLQESSSKAVREALGLYPGLERQRRREAKQAPGESLEDTT